MVSKIQQRITKLKEQRIKEDIEKLGEDFFKLEKIGNRYVPNEQQKEFIINTYQMKYEDGKSLGQRFDRSSTWINERLKRWGVPIKKPSELFTLHEYNEDYFKVIDTEEKAYWLGMIYADGTITYNKLQKNGKTRNRFKLTLKATDKPHLEKFAHAIDFKYPELNVHKTIVEGKEYEYVDLIASSPTFIKHLIDKGMIPTNNSIGRDKKELIRFPQEDKLPRHLLKHFVRGYFDGDGSLTKQRYEGKVIDTQHYTVKIVSNKIFCQQLKDFFELHELTDYKKQTKNIYKKKDSYIYTFESGGNHRVYHIYNKFYKDANIYLDRKYNKFKQFIDYFKENNFTNDEYSNRPMHHDKRINNKTNKLIFE